MPLVEIAWLGGILSVLTLLHFISDWIFQSHDEAMKKSSDALVRARHCLVYTGIITAVFLVAFRLSPVEIVAYASVLFFSHFVEDSYLPVYLWAKHIRKAPEFTAPEVLARNEAGVIIHRKTEKEKFIAFASTVLGKILLIAIDQIIHIIYLASIAGMMLVAREPTKFWVLYGSTMGTIVVFAVLSGRAKKDLDETT